MLVPHNIFRKYDIRGIYPEELNDKIAYHVGRAFGTYLSRQGLKNCVIGRDNRKSSPSLNRETIKGLIESGIDVIDTGVTLTPIALFATCELGYDSCITVTASHNPPEFGGIKLVTKDATPYAGNELQDLIKVIEDEDYVTGEGSVTQKDLLEPYISFLKSKFKFKGSMDVVFECGFGPSGDVVPKMLNALGIKAAVLNSEPDSDFPIGVPDPENPNFMQNLQDRVKERGADLGIALDTDGDRVGLVGRSGRLYKTDEILLLLAEDVLNKYPGSEIIFDVKCSETAGEVISGLGGKPKMLKTGRSNFEDEMKKGAALGVEFSGHVYFGNDYFGYDDGIYAALRIIEILEKAEKDLDELMSKYPLRAGTSEIKVPISDDKKENAVAGIKKTVEDSKDYIKILAIDGVRAYISDTGWFLVRASGTSPYLSARMEGKDEKELALVKEKFEQVIQKIQ